MENNEEITDILAQVWAEAHEAGYQEAHDEADYNAGRIDTYVYPVNPYLPESY